MKNASFCMEPLLLYGTPLDTKNLKKNNCEVSYTYGAS